MLLDGSEPLVAYGLDTTSHWWALTSPTTDGVRLIVDNKHSAIYKQIEKLTFSPDGNRWACFAKDNSQWYLLTDDTIIPLPGTSFGEIAYSPNSEVLVYSYMEGDHERIILNSRSILVYQRTGSLFLSEGGERYALMGWRGDKIVVNINGNETTLFDEIKPFGFWYDGSFLYAGRNGSTWEVYKNNNSITEQFMEISRVAINLRGNVAAFLARKNANQAYGVLIADEYTEPLMSKPYDNVANLLLHPTLPMLAFSAGISGKEYVVLSNTEYVGGQEATSAPHFTYDGSELYFVGCNIDCFVNINGKKYALGNVISTQLPYAVKPRSETMAYSTNSSLIVRDLLHKELTAGMMVDTLLQPRYNWRTQRYETLGQISQKLYLMTCTN